MRDDPSAPPPPAPESPRFTLQGIRHGFVSAQPLTPSVFIYGALFGVLASERGLSWLESMLMSMFVYSGSAQIAALESWALSPMVLPVIFTTLVINARYVLYGAAIRPMLESARPGQAYLSLFFMGDGTWALSMREFGAGNRDAGFVLGSGLASFFPWCVGTITGFALGRMIPDPTALGLDFMLVAFATALWMTMWRDSRDLWPSVAAGVVAWLLHRFVPGGWYIVGAGLTGAAVGAWRQRD